MKYTIYWTVAKATHTHTHTHTHIPTLHTTIFFWVSFFLSGPFFHSSLPPPPLFFLSLTFFFFLFCFIFFSFCFPLPPTLFPDTGTVFCETCTKSIFGGCGKQKITLHMSYPVCLTLFTSHQVYLTNKVKTVTSGTDTWRTVHPLCWYMCKQVL